jgi:hypothetical protein
MMHCPELALIGTSGCGEAEEDLPALAGQVPEAI